MQPSPQVMTFRCDQNTMKKTISKGEEPDRKIKAEQGANIAPRASRLLFGGHVSTQRKSRLATALTSGGVVYIIIDDVT